MSCIVDSAAIYIMVVKLRNTICPPPPQLSLHRRAVLSSNSNRTRSVYSRENPKSSLYCEMSMKCGTRYGTGTYCTCSTGWFVISITHSIPFLVPEYELCSTRIIFYRSVLFETVEPLVKTTLEGFKLSGFMFDRDRVFLGQVPPRITGVKVSSNNTLKVSEATSLELNIRYLLAILDVLFSMVASGPLREPPCCFIHAICFLMARAMSTWHGMIYKSFFKSSPSCESNMRSWRRLLCVHA
jgi:hypothetical protein